MLAVLLVFLIKPAAPGVFVNKTEIISQTGFAHLTDLPCLKLQFADATAVVSLYGGQVLSYQPTPDNEQLWLSEQAQWHNGSAIRGGVPVCWPWFGPAECKINPAQSPLPNHGLVRNRMWQIQHTETTASASCATLTTTVNDMPSTLWPQTTSVQQTAALSLTLKLDACQLSIQLSCSSQLYQQAALHSYFRVNSLLQSQVTGLSPRYFDKVSNTERHNTGSDVRCTAETDRIYPDTGNTLQLIDNNRQLRIHQSGHDASVIWNPWQQKSRDLPDMTDHGFTEFICIETARLKLEVATDLTLQQTLIPL
tara:strand:- start:1515 stop:2441 length:927 start_codon:yes stop_codon:yes gene_type:complete